MKRHIAHAGLIGTINILLAFVLMPYIFTQLSPIFEKITRVDTGGSIVLKFIFFCFIFAISVIPQSILLYMQLKKDRILISRSPRPQKTWCLLASMIAFLISTYTNEALRGNAYWPGSYIFMPACTFLLTALFYLLLRLRQHQRLTRQVH